MADNLGIRIIAKLDKTKSISQINADLEQIAKGIDLDIGINVKGLSKELDKKLQQVSKSAQKSMDIDMSNITKEGTDVVKTVKDIEKQYGGTVQSIVKNLNVVEKEQGQLEEQLKDYLVTVKTVENTMKKVRLSPFEDRNDPNKTVLRPDSVQEIDREREAREKYIKWWQSQLATIDKQERSRAERASKEREQALKYEQQTRQAIEKTLKSEKKQSEELEYQVQKAKELARYKVQDLERRYGAVLTNDQRGQMESYINSMDRITKDTPNATREIDRLNTSFKGIQTSVAEAGSRAETFGSQLKTALSRVPIWMGAMTAFYAPLRGMQNAIDQIVMLDTQMTELRRVMDATPQTYNRLLEQSIELSTELGNRVESVNEAMVGFARQGYDPTTLMALTETATIASNISNMQAEEAMSILTAAMQAYNIEAEKSIEVVDKLNEVDNNFAIDTQTLAQAMQKSASVANTYSVEMSDLLGMISAIGITTRESGQVIGRMLPM